MTLRIGLKTVSLLATSAVLCPIAPALAQAADNAAPSNSSQQQITVTGNRRAYDSRIDRRTYRIGSDVQAANGTLADVLRNIPSVDVDLQGNVSIRGDSNVTILVDGKPTSLFRGPGGGQTLQQVPASQYESVEVMTNPSAAYSATGSGGIINLITRKNRASGPVATVRGAVGTRGRRNAGGSFSDKQGKLSVSLNASWRGDPQFSTDITNFQQSEPGQPPSLFSREVTKGVGNLHLWTTRGGADLDLNSADRLSAELHHTTFVYHSDMTTQLIGKDAGGDVVRIFDRSTFLQQNRFDTEASLSFRHDPGKGNDWSASLTYERTNEDNRDVSQNIDVLPPAPDLFNNIARLTRSSRLEAKADADSQLPDDASLQTGADVEVTRDRFDDVGGFGSTAEIAAMPQPQFTNLFQFDRTIAAAYAIYERPFGKLTAQGGIRVEDEAHSAPGAHRSDARLFPSLHLEWKPQKDLTVNASVSTRIERPDPSDFDPFRRFIDPFHFEAGNPDLKPETTVAFEGGVERKKGATLQIATLYYRSKRHGVTDVSEDLGDGVFLTTRENLRGSTNLGLELVANGPIAKTLKYRLSGNFYRYTIDAANLGFGKRSALIESGKAGLDWQPDKRDLAQVNVSLTGKTLLPQGVVDPMLLVNLGYRHRVTDRLFAFVTAQDALHTYKRHSVVRTPTLIESVEDSAKTQAAFVGLTYNIGGKSAKDPAFDYSG